MAANPTTNQQTPIDDGKPLATLNRGGDRQLRIRWREFKGYHFLDLREWARRDEQSPYWPVKGRGITVKAHELADVAKALGEALELSR